jgi:hypothetical protein
MLEVIWSAIEWLIVDVIAKFVVVTIGTVVATPFILISAPFRTSGVKGGYVTLFRWFDEII